MASFNKVRILSRKSDLAIIQAKEIGNILQKKNKKVAILTRGYGRKKRGHFLVTDGQSTLENINANYC